MVDPGIVLDTIAAETGDQQRLGYAWPEETRLVAVSWSRAGVCRQSDLRSRENSGTVAR